MNRSTNKINHQKAARIIAHYSAAHQLIKLCEECGELIQQAVKCYERGVHYSDGLIEEMADVIVMILQFESIMSSHDTKLLQTTVTQKLDRQIKRIESEAARR